MKFPLARHPFGELDLAKDEAKQMSALADDLVTSTLREREDFELAHQRRPDDRRWKRVRRLNGCIELHRERDAFVPSRPPSFLVVGQLGCSLDDLVYSVSAPTTEAQRVRSSFAPDGLLDCQLIHTIIEPTPMDPLRHLVLQWCVMGSTSRARSLVQHPRDFVVLDGAGFVESPTEDAPRSGFWVRHSVDIDAVPELKHWRLTRGQLSMCAVFRELSTGITEIYMRLFFDPQGPLSNMVATSMAIDQVEALTKLHHCAQMKKLVMAVRDREFRALKQSSEIAPEDDTSLLHRPDDGSGEACLACKRPVAIVLTHRCSLCCRAICRSCRIRRELIFMGRYNRILRTKMSFCTACISQAIHRDAVSVANQELAHSFLLATSSATISRSTATLFSTQLSVSSPRRSAFHSNEFMSFP
ncbi:hypothetical protein ATCC90586_001009 [Pythium insidiosum]|nr:hypothetical protein ATCC90586_001009 [Pythium insidiosum]